MGRVTRNGDLRLRDRSDFFGAVDLLGGATDNDMISAVATSLSSAIGNWEKLHIRLTVDWLKGAPFNILLGRVAGTESHENYIG